MCGLTARMHFGHRPWHVPPEACMLVFLTSCRDVDQEVSPKTAFVYLSAVRKYFQVNGLDVDFFKDSHFIQNTKAGMLNAYRMTINRDVKDTERLPISICASVYLSMESCRWLCMLLSCWDTHFCLAFPNTNLCLLKLNTCCCQRMFCFR